MSVKLMNVREFPNIECDKAMATKPLEEAAEVFGAWQNMEHNLGIVTTLNLKTDIKSDLEIALVDDCLYELADCITACCNMAASLGCCDLTAYLYRVEEHNEERGRYDK